MRGHILLALSPLAAAGLLAAGAAPAAAQTRIAVGRFTGTQTCTTYTLTSGSEAMVARAGRAVAANAYGYAAASSASIAWARTWRTELVRDCQTEFAGLRASMAAALGAAPNVVVVPPGTRGALVLTGRVSPVGTSSNSYSDASEASDGSNAGVTVEFTLRGPGGGIEFGNSIAKQVTFGANLNTGGSSISSSQSSNSTYGQLQRASAFAVARSVSFHVNPLRVVAVSGRRVRLNYGAPLLNPGDAVTLDGGVEMGMLRTNVVSAGNGFADVESEGGADLSGIRPGSIATFAEPEDPNSQVPSYERVEMPRG